MFVRIKNTLLSFPCDSLVKNPPANARDTGNASLIPWVEKIRWRRKWQPTPVVLPAESYGHRSLAGYSPQGRKVLDTTKHVHKAKDIIIYVLLLGKLWFVQFYFQHLLQDLTFIDLIK